MRHLIMLGCVFAIFACSTPAENNGGTNNSERKEGTFTGDCDNGTDDDDNGLTDCDDPGCAGAPDCGDSSNNGEKLVPEGWLCHADLYDADDGCDCNCASDVRDPDCDKPNQPVLGCTDPNATCNANGVCQTPAMCDDLSTCELRECGFGTDGCTPCGPDCPGTQVCVQGECEDPPTNNGTNNGVDPDAHTVLFIADQTEDEALCDLDDAGSDIFGVALYDREDNLIAWGESVYSQLTSTQFDDPSVLSGDAPMLDGDDCPLNYDPTTVVALGCGGIIAVSFEEAGTTVGLGDPARPVTVVVHEFGDQCGSQVVDQFAVATCDATFLEDADLGECEPRATNLSGEARIFL